MRSALIALMISVLTTTVVAADACDIIILIGQSNMDGRGAIADLPPTLKEPNPQFLIYYRNPPFVSDGWQPLAPGFSIAPGFKGKTLPGTTFGCELTFAPALATALPHFHIALLKASKGGTSLAKDWQPGVTGQTASQGPCYQNFLSSVTAALPALPGGPHHIRGVVWHQGESDAGLASGEYEKLLITFIARVREDLSLPDLPFVIGEVYDNQKRDHVRADEQATAHVVPHTAFVSCSGLVTFDQGTHFDAAGQMELGKRYAEAMAALCTSHYNVP